MQPRAGPEQAQRGPTRSSQAEKHRKTPRLRWQAEEHRDTPRPHYECRFFAPEQAPYKSRLRAPVEPSVSISAPRRPDGPIDARVFRTRRPDGSTV